MTGGVLCRSDHETDGGFWSLVEDDAPTTGT